MPDLDFFVESVEAERFAAAPLLAFKLKVTNRDPGEFICSAAVRCQIMLEPVRRTYRPGDQERLRDLFGEPERWSQTLRPMLWTHASVVVPQFEGNTSVILPVPCTFDFNIAATKYFHGIEDGEVPLNLLFSGTVFYTHENETMQVVPISWNKETRYRLPIGVWKSLMDLHYPNSAMLRLRRDVFERLYNYKVRQGIPTWEATIETLLAAVEEMVAP
jgi:hypothetical protein